MIRAAFCLVFVLLMGTQGFAQTGSGSRNGITWTMTPAWQKVAGVEGESWFSSGETLEVRYRFDVFNNSTAFASLYGSVTISDGEDSEFTATNSIGLNPGEGDVFYVTCTLTNPELEDHYDEVNFGTESGLGVKDLWDYNSTYTFRDE